MFIEWDYIDLARNISHEMPQFFGLFDAVGDALEQYILKRHAVARFTYVLAACIEKFVNAPLKLF